MPRPRPWDRLPDEPPRAYEAFCFYLELGMRRSLDRLGRERYPGPGTRKRGRTGRLETWSKRWRWRERADAFDGAEIRAGMAGYLRDRRAAGEAKSRSYRAAIAEGRRAREDRLLGRGPGGG